MERNGACADNPLGAGESQPLSALGRLPARGAKELFFGGLNLVVAALIAFGIFAALPLRWWVVDWGAAVAVASLVAAAIGLLLGTPWRFRVARGVAWGLLLLGILLILGLVSGASYLWGIYGPVGRGGALIFVLVLLLLIPYLVAYPVAQLVWIGPHRRSGPVGQSKSHGGRG